MINFENELNSGVNKFVLTSLVLAFGVILFRTAWLCDDAYITFRVADNFAHGYGLVWNAGERVQVFTHPLWMLLLTSFNLVTGEIYYTSIFLSMALAIGAVALTGFRVSATLGSAILAILVLSISKAFVEYSTSGLENPLTFLLLAIFYWQFLSGQFDLRKLLILSFMASLVALNRLDTLLLILPALVYAYSKVPRFKGALVGLAGFIPLILWFVFALVYYGSVLPNTYYAKLNNGISSFKLIVQGLNYILDSLRFDSTTIVTLIAGLTVAFKSKDRGQYAGAIGVCLYLIYAVNIGGDFMSGRFLGAPLICSVVLLTSRPLNLTSKKYALLFGTIIVYGFLWPETPVLSGKDFGISRDNLSRGHGITNERAYYFQGTGLLLAGGNGARPNFEWYRGGEDLRNGHVKAKVLGSVGFAGYAAGPDVHIIDYNALADPLLARLPPFEMNSWRIGHFFRLVPQGYEKTVATSQIQIADTGLAVYYEKLRILTAGEIFDWNRLAEIWNFNLGKYDYLTENFFKSAVHDVDYAKINTPIPQGTAWNAEGVSLIKESGIRINLPEEHKDNFLEISVDNNDRYYVGLFKGRRRLSELIIEPRTVLGRGGLRVDTLSIPQKAVKKGYDVLEIYRLAGDDLYSVGHVRLFSNERTAE